LFLATTSARLPATAGIARIVAGSRIGRPTMGTSGSWEFDPATLSLVNGTHVARLTRKSGDVLACLIRNQGQVVSQAKLLKEVWPNLHVTPDLVREYISDLRTLMGDNARAPQLIETVRGRGYRLCAPIGAPASTPGASPLVRVAVIGLADRSIEGRWKRLALGLADDVAAELSRYSDLAVIARNDQAAPDGEADVRAIAGQFGARYAVTGKIDVAGDALRVLVSLVEASTGRIRWTRRIARHVADLPLVSEEIAAAIAGSLGGLLGEIHRLERDLVRRKPPESLDAYEHYLLGCCTEPRYDRESILLAVKHLEKAIAKDPNIARCWLTYGFHCGLISVSGWPEDDGSWEMRQRRAVERAFELDPRDPMILTERAKYLAMDRRQAEALDQIERACDLAENHSESCVSLSYAMALVAGDGARALALVDRALNLNPDPPGWFRNYECRAAFFAGDYKRCVAVATQAPDCMPTFVYGSLSAVELGRVEVACGFWNGLFRLYPGFDFEKYSAPMVHPAALQAFRASFAKLEGALAQRSEISV
jgi:TolB-like protein